ncbi:adenylate/guanylate cyclase domain-containing protein [Desulfatibacillum aliphaticivorans]|uniref:adenylate/guanylate cyclase domain-containing protein n=1 Tax=Desulfatibacillum aliphaticivorans TaxID=218208 RepID=UPI0004063564|nr:adenylate/guanylate cyclase domain-containing protein [Desulfatibacillum aliphaticivorans]
MKDNTPNKFFSFITQPPESAPSRLQQFYFFSTYGYCAGCLLYAALCIYLIQQGMLPLAGTCGGLAALFALGVVLNIHGRLKAGMLFVIFGQCAQAWASVYISGYTGFHHYLVPLMVMSLLYPGRRKIQGAALGLIVGLEFAALTHLAPRTSPAYLTYIQTAQFLRGANLYLSLFSMSMAAIYYGIASEQSRKKHEQHEEKTRTLLHNVLPEEIAEKLGSRPGIITEEFENVSILFSDIVGFTALSRTMPPDEVVSLLNRIFSQFDDLAGRHGMEKIKTIGDAYMCTAGIPQFRADHAESAARMALDMMREFNRVAREIGQPLQLRIGINSGAVVAGVIGKTKFSYDLWGNSVNAASRMASHGMPGEIQVTSSTYDLLKEKFVMEERGPVDIKGIGLMTTFLLKDSRAG